MTICRTRLFNFLQTELALSPAAIALALRQVGPDLDLVPVVLWQYGPVNLLELEQLWDWLHQAAPHTALTLVKSGPGTPPPLQTSPASLPTAA